MKTDNPSEPVTPRTQTSLGKEVWWWWSVALTVIAAFLLIKGVLFLIYPEKVRESFDRLEAAFSQQGNFEVAVGKTCAQNGQPCMESFIVTGSTTLGTAAKFIKQLKPLMAANPDIRVVCFNSPGGAVEEAAAMAKFLVEQELDTCVGDYPQPRGTAYFQAGKTLTAQCESACTLLVLAGKNRISIGDRYRFGVHSGSSAYGGMTRAEIDQSMANSFTPENTRVSAEQLTAITQFSNRTPSWAMYSLTLKEQMDLGFFTQHLAVPSRVIEPTL